MPAAVGRGAQFRRATPLSFRTCFRFDAALDTLEAAIADVGELGSGRLDPVARLRTLTRLETAVRRQYVVIYDGIVSLADEDSADVGGPVHKVIADWLRIGCAEMLRRRSILHSTFTGSVGQSHTNCVVL